MYAKYKWSYELKNVSILSSFFLKEMRALRLKAFYSFIFESFHCERERERERIEVFELFRCLFWPSLKRPPLERSTFIQSETRDGHAKIQRK